MPQVILADKSNLFRRSMSTVLEREGYGVQAVETGAKLWEALQLVKPLAVILDLEIEGPSGLDLLVSIKADPKLKHVPVLVVSRDGATATVSNAFRLGAESFLIKPIELTVLLKTLAKIKHAEPVFNAPIGLIAAGERLVGRLRFTDQYGLVYLDKEQPHAFAPVGSLITMAFDVGHAHYMQRVLVVEENEQGIALFPVGTAVTEGEPALAQLPIQLKSRYLLPGQFMRLADVVEVQADALRLKGLASEPKANAPIQLTVYPPTSGADLGGIPLKGQVGGFQNAPGGTFDAQITLEAPVPLPYVELLAEQMSGRPARAIAR